MASVLSCIAPRWQWPLGPDTALLQVSPSESADRAAVRRTAPMFADIGKYHELYLHDTIPNMVNALARAGSMVSTFYLPRPTKEPTAASLKSILLLDFKTSNLSCCSGMKPILTTSDFDAAICELAAVLKLIFGDPLSTALWSLYRDLKDLAGVCPSLTVSDKVAIVTRAFNLILFPSSTQIALPLWPSPDDNQSLVGIAFSVNRDDPHIVAVVNASLQRAFTATINSVPSATRPPRSRNDKRPRSTDSTTAGTATSLPDPNSNWADKTNDVPSPPRVGGKLPCFDWVIGICTANHCRRPHQYPPSTSTAVKDAVSAWIVAHKVRKT